MRRTRFRFVGVGTDRQRHGALAVDEAMAAVGEANMCHAAADDADHHRLDHRQREQRRDRRIDGVAAGCQHLGARARGQRMIAHHHAAAGSRRLLLTLKSGGRAIPPVAGHVVSRFFGARRSQFSRVTRHFSDFRLAVVMRELDVANELGTGLLLDAAGRFIGNHVANVELLDSERVEGKIVYGRDGLGHQPAIPIGLGEPESPVAFRAVRRGSKMDVADGLAVARSQYQDPMIEFFARGDCIQLSPDKAFRAVVRIRPGHDGCEIPENVPVVEMALDRRRVG